MKLSFLFLFFIFLTMIYFSFCKELIDYFRGTKVTANEEKRNGKSNDCICDITPNSCDYLCCCDEECPEDAIKDWNDHLICIDEKDTIGIFADRCIDHNLVAFTNDRRGLKRDVQTEDTKTGTEIKNYCYSMDNSGKMTNNIISLNDLENYGYNKITNDLLNKIIESLNEEEKNNGNNRRNLEEGEDDKNSITISCSSEEYEHFCKNGKFSLLSGTNCGQSNNVILLKPENYSCYMNNKITKNEIDTINFLGCESNEKTTYYIENGLFSYKKVPESSCREIDRIREVEFIFKISSTFSIEECSINYVCENINENGYKFKNSVTFIQEGNTFKLPYRYSGQGGYLNYCPLKIVDNQNMVYNEYYITGKNFSNNCRYNESDKKIFNYYYDKDAPLSFKENMVYSCNLTENQIDKTTLYKRIQNIKYIARYGSSSYENLDSYDWINVNNYFTEQLRKIDFNNGNNLDLIMNIYIGTEETQKYIYNITLNHKITTIDGQNDNIFNFRVNYYDLKEELDIENKYTKNRPFPTIIPPLPKDLLDPLIYSEVEK